MPTRVIKKWACPRCQTSPCIGEACETCGSGPDWKRPERPPLETPNEKARREARQKAEAEAEAKHQDRMARKAEIDAERARIAAEESKKPKPLNKDLVDAIRFVVSEEIAKSKQ